MCVGCPRGYFSFNSSNTVCQRCFLNGVCNGTNETEVVPGYWRSSRSSIRAFVCPAAESCLGGMDSSCALGYYGRMCNLCTEDPIDGEYYARSGPYKCTKCSPLGL